MLTGNEFSPLLVPIAGQMNVGGMGGSLQILLSGSFPKPTTKSNELPPSQHFWQNPNPDFTSLIYTPLSSLDATFKADRNTILAIVETRVDNPEDSPEHQAHRPQSESNGTSSLQS